MKFEESKSFQNLAKAFAGESQARNRYVFAAAIAKNEGFQAVQRTFLSTAENEQEHAKVFYKLLAKYAPGRDLIHVDADYPLAYGDTLANLKAAAAGEKEEWEVIYTDFAAIAGQEGFPDIQTAFQTIASVEKHHYQRYAELVNAVETGTLFKKDSPVAWKCTNCGYVHHGTEAPHTCPACLHPQGYFIDLPQNY
ncbi:MAG TPA: rubrerythrin family protein [Peptococcaceae bacterium]|nr:rubrerythrin family protein [Peptococcaceae bacterium]